MARISKEALWVMLFATVRYSMGRRTYMSGYCLDLIRAHARHLEPYQRRQIKEEVQKELSRVREIGSLLGDKCDDDAWQEVVEYLSKATDDPLCNYILPFRRLDFVP